MNPFASFVPKRSNIIQVSDDLVHQEENDIKRSRYHENQSLSALTCILLDIDNHALDLNIVEDNSIVTASNKQKDKPHYDRRYSKHFHINEINLDNPLLYQKITIESNFDLNSLVSDYKTSDNLGILDKHSNFKAQQQNYIYPLENRKVDKFTTHDYITSNIDKSKYWTTLSDNNLSSSSLTVVNNELEFALQYVKLRLLHWQEAVHSALHKLYYDDHTNMDNYIYIIGEIIKSTGSEPKLHMPTSYYSAYIYPVVIANNVDYRCIIIGINKTILTRLHQLDITIYELVNRNNMDNNSSKSSKSNDKENISTAGLLKLSRKGRNIMIFGKYSISIFINIIVEYIFGMLENKNHSIQSQHIDVPTILSNISFMHSSSSPSINIPILCQYKFNHLKEQFNDNSINKKQLILNALDYSNPTILPIHKISMSGYLYTKKSIRPLLELLVNISNDYYCNDNNKTSKKKLNTYDYLANQLTNYSNDLKSNPMKNNTTTSTISSSNTIYQGSSFNNNSNISNSNNNITLLNPMQLLTTASVKYKNNDNDINNYVNDDIDLLIYTHSQQDSTIKYIEKENQEDFQIFPENRNPSELLSHDHWIKDKRSRKLPYFSIQFMISSDYNMLLQKKLFSYASKNEIQLNNNNNNNNNNNDLYNSNNHSIIMEPYDIIEEIRWFDSSDSSTMNPDDTNNMNNNHIEVIYRSLEPMELKCIIVNQQNDSMKMDDHESSPSDIGLQKDGSIILQPLNAYSIYAND